MSKQNFISLHLLSECVKADALDCFDYLIERRPVTGHSAIAQVELCSSVLHTVSKWGRYRFLARFHPWLMDESVAPADRTTIVEEGIKAAVEAGHYGMIEWFKSIPNEEGHVLPFVKKQTIPVLLWLAMRGAATPKDPGPMPPYVERPYFETSTSNYDLKMIQIQQEKKRRLEFHESDWRERVAKYEKDRERATLQEAARFHMVDLICRETGDENWVALAQEALFMGTRLTNKETDLEPTNLKLWEMIRKRQKESLPTEENSESSSAQIDRPKTSDYGIASYFVRSFYQDSSAWMQTGGCIFFGLDTSRVVSLNSVVDGAPDAKVGTNVRETATATAMDLKSDKNISSASDDTKNPRLHIFLHAPPQNAAPHLYGTLLARALTCGMHELAGQIMADGFVRPCYQMLSIASEGEIEKNRMECCATVLDAGELTIFANPPWAAADTETGAEVFPKNTWREVISREPVMRALGAKEQRENFAAMAVVQFCTIVPGMNKDVAGLIAMYFLGTTGARLSAIKAWIYRLTGRSSQAAVKMEPVAMVVEEQERPLMPAPYRFHPN